MRARAERGDRKFTLRALGLELTLPAAWIQQTADPGWKFKAAVPTSGASVFINTIPVSQDPRGFTADLVAFERKNARAHDKHATVTVRNAKVAGVPAVEITAHYSGLTAYLYGFTHGGRHYTLEWAAQTALLAQAQPAFASGLRSLRFLT